MTKALNEVLGTGHLGLTETLVEKIWYKLALQSWTLLLFSLGFLSKQLYSPRLSSHFKRLLLM